jgi:hypothetical protein
MGVRALQLWESRSITDTNQPGPEVDGHLLHSPDVREMLISAAGGA